jgi:hypothetical protein
MLAGDLWVLYVQLLDVWTAHEVVHANGSTWEIMVLEISQAHHILPSFAEMAPPSGVILMLILMLA